MAGEADALTVSVVIPCLNEEQSIESCVRTARSVLDEHGISGEVVVADNDSEDDSAALATAAGRASRARGQARLRQRLPGRFRRGARAPTS